MDSERSFHNTWKSNICSCPSTTLRGFAIHQNVTKNSFRPLTSIHDIAKYYATACRLPNGDKTHQLMYIYHLYFLLYLRSALKLTGLMAFNQCNERVNM